MSNHHLGYDYLFVSDLHLSLGYDPQRRAYHPREDFFFDGPFFRWLRWADQHCAPGRRWELVFAGDTFDFLPVDCEVVERYFQELERRQRAFDPADPRQVAAYWEEQFGAPSPGERVPERVQRLIFEDDVLAGRVHLAPMPAAEGAAPPQVTPVPEWAVRLYARYRSPAAGAARERQGQYVVRTGEERLAAVPGVRRPPARARRERAFERRYGFLPTPEKSGSKLESIYRGHPLFFRGLAWFVGQGHRVVFMRGNHDLELFWPAVQERLREFVAREYPAACGPQPGGTPPPDFETHIDFRPGWIYHRRGTFYAEHGSQYEPLSACPNPIRPLLPGEEWLLCPDVGSLGVVCFHNHLENVYPEWENQGECTVVLADLIRRDPLRALAILIRHAPDFLRMAQRLWQAGRGKEQKLEPTAEDYARCAEITGLGPEVLRHIYREGDRPLLVRRGLAWLLFSPGGHAVKALLLVGLGGLALGAGAAWYLVAAPALAGLIPSELLFTTVGPALQLLAKVALWLFPPAAYALVRRRMGQRYLGSFLFQATRRLHGHLRVEDPGLRYYLLGHDHRPDVRPVERREDGRHVYYLNTGSWTPCFAEGGRRLQTLGREVQFTFARLVRGEGGYQAELLRWNDDAGRAELQVVPPADGRVGAPARR